MPQPHSNAHRPSLLCPLRSTSLEWPFSLAGAERQPAFVRTHLGS